MHFIATPMLSSMFRLHRVCLLQAPHPATVSQSVARYARANTRALNTAAQPSSLRSSRWPRRLLYMAIFGTCGAAFIGSWMDENVSAPALPGTLEDQGRLEAINSKFEHWLPIVQRLRANPDYVEADVYGNFSEDEKTQRLTSGPLRGSRGIGLQVRCLSDPRAGMMQRSRPDAVKPQCIPWRGAWPGWTISFD